MVEINWTKIVQEDLQDIYDFIAMNSIKYANITTTKIYNEVQN